MLTSSSTSHYLPPDYLQPLPTTLDAKNSPLALLAQTCSSIGKDPPSKSVIPPLEKKDKVHPEKSHSVDSNKGSPPKSKDGGRISSERSRPGSSEEAKDLSYFRPLSTSSPKQEKISEPAYHKEHADKKPVESVSVTTSVITRPNATPNVITSKQTERVNERSPHPKTNEQVKEPKEARDSPPLKRQRSASPMRSEHSPATDSKYPPALYPGLPLGPWGYPGLPYPPGLLQSPEAFAASGIPMGVPGQTGYNLSQSVQASALAAHHAALKSGSSLSNYLQYTRMRTPSGQGPLLNPCRDPFCTNCLASAQSSHLSQCTSPGCAQCTHEKSLQTMGLSALGLHGSVPGLSPFSSANGLPSASAGLSSLHSLYAQNLMTQQQGHPHICNWMSGSDYCGKRFTTSEELLQHLRTHTSGGESALAAYGSLGISIPSPADISALHGYLGSAGSLSPGALRRTYPTSLSPLSSSSLHANRYHPYKSSLSNVPVGLPAPHSLGPYYSAYGLYGQRIGSAAVP